MSGSLQLSRSSSEKLTKHNLSGESDPVEVQRHQLDGVKGAVCTTQKVTIPPFQTLTLKGNVGVKGHCMKVHVLTEPALGPQLPAAVVPIATYGELHPGSSRVPICLRNMSSRAVEIPAKTVVGQVTPANQVPPVVHPTRTATETGTKLQKGWVLEALDLQGLQDWPKSEQEQARKLLLNWEHLFAQDDLDLGKTALIKHKIKLTNQTPFKERYRRIPPHMYDDVRAHIQEMLDIGAIRKSHSPWASAVVLVRKKDGGLRFCIDLRKLNERTIKDAYSLPRIDETLDSLQGSQWFSSLDLKSGYWQVEMDEESKPLTAFTVGPLGFYECERMPFGLTNAPATFQRLMENCLGDLNLHWCIIYLDDIVIFSKDPVSHLERLEAVFRKLEEAGLKLKPSKCELFRRRLAYLGHVISAEGVATDESKIEAIKNWPTPITVTNVRSFLGFTGYYRRFIPKYVQVARPLHELTSGENAGKKKAAIKWDSRCQKAFDDLKTLCTTAPILAYADFTKPFKLHTDACGTGLGAVLYQTREDGTEAVIAYASRSLNKAESHYPAHKLEFLALKWAVVEKFHEYLYGSTFDVHTDNNPLMYILTTAKLDAASHRWVASLANYNFRLHYRSGKANIDADALSRVSWPECVPDNSGTGLKVNAAAVRAIQEAALDQPACPIEAYSHDIHVVGEMQDSQQVAQMTLDDWRRAQEADPALAAIIEKLKAGSLDQDWCKQTNSPELNLYKWERNNLTLQKGILYRRARPRESDESLLQLVLPPAYREVALKGCHDEVGHLGLERMLDLMRDRFFWPHMAVQVKEHVGKCRPCLAFKARQPKAPLENIVATHPLELVHLDFLCLEPGKGREENVLVITDHFTRYAQAYVTRTQMAQTTAKTLWDKFIVHYGLPEKILTDQGRNFESQLVADLCVLMGVRKIRTSPYRLQTNGQCERFNSTLINMLGTLPKEKKSEWKDHVGTLVHAYNCTRNSATGFSPYYLMFGRQPHLPVDVTLGLAPRTITEPSTTKFAQKLRDRNKWAHNKAEAFQAKEAERHKRNFDKKSKAAALEVGDTVLVRVTTFKGRHKMQNRWENSEYVVEKRPYPDLPVYVVCPRDGEGAAEPCIGTIYFPSVLTWGRMRQVSLKVESKMTPL